jgi:hypothetical protein
VTNPTGRVFVSYRRSRATEIEDLVTTLHSYGIPTWQDVQNLEEVPTEERLRAVIRDSETSGGILWLTPEVVDSPMIREVEIPEVLKRAKGDTTFFVIPVLAGGLDFSDLEVLFSGIGHADELRRWNVRRAADGVDSSAQIAQLVLERRLTILHSELPEEVPLDMAFYTRALAPIGPTSALVVDWSTLLTPRPAPPSVWNDHLIPAISAVAEATRIHAPGRRVVAGGLVSIPAAVVLGAAFLTVTGSDLAWKQLTDGRLSEWRLSEDRGSTNFQVRAEAGDVGATDLAIEISITSDVTLAMSASSHVLPAFRAIVRAHPASGSSGDLARSVDAERLARAVIAQAREARTNYRITGDAHLFIAGPLGVAVMIGRMLNTFGRVHTYEFLSDENGSIYAPAAVVRGTR